MARTAAEADRAEERADSIVDVLQRRFDRVPVRLVRSIQAITDLAVSRRLMCTAVDVPSLEAFKRALATATAPRRKPRRSSRRS